MYPLKQGKFLTKTNLQLVLAQATTGPRDSPEVWASTRLQGQRGVICHLFKEEPNHGTLPSILRLTVLEYSPSRIEWGQRFDP